MQTVVSPPIRATWTRPALPRLRQLALCQSPSPTFTLLLGGACEMRELNAKINVVLALARFGPRLEDDNNHVKPPRSVEGNRLSRAED
jgi:hypothetical protein